MVALPLFSMYKSLYITDEFKSATYKNHYIHKIEFVLNAVHLAAMNIKLNIHQTFITQLSYRKLAFNCNYFEEHSLTQLNAEVPARFLCSAIKGSVALNAKHSSGKDGKYVHRSFTATLLASLLIITSR